MLDLIIVSIVLSYFLLVWFRTNAFVEYINILKLSRFFCVSEYNELHRNGYDGNYVSFLYEYYKDYFLVRLISCPVCVSFWLGVFFSIIYGSFLGLLVSPLMLFFYLLFNKML